MLDKIVNNLIAGNKRFFTENCIHPNIMQETRIKSSKNQTPKAIVVSCSDSRVPIEILFDVGIGDLFVIRSAGHILTQSGIASIEYAIKHLNTKLIVVLGHTNCGAVSSALHNEEKLSDNMQIIIDRIKPSVEEAHRCCNNANDVLNYAIQLNVNKTIEYIKNSKDLIHENIKIVGAIYNIESGVVKFLD